MTDHGTTSHSSDTTYFRTPEAIKRLKTYYEKKREEQTCEQRALINFQSTALKAIQLQALLQPLVIEKPKSPLSKLEQQRLERILHKGEESKQIYCQ